MTDHHPLPLLSLKGANKQSVKKEFDPDVELTEIEVEPYIQVCMAIICSLHSGLYGYL